MGRLFSFLFFMGALLGAVYGSMFLVAKYLEPEERKMEHSIGRIKIQR